MSEVILYRFFNADKLLYVGISSRIPERVREHKLRSSFFQIADRVTLERLPDRGAALEAERLAIQLERPTYNIVHNSAGSRFPLEEQIAPTEWIFKERRNRDSLRHCQLLLYGELDGSSCIQESGSSDGETQVEYYFEWLRANQPECLEKNSVQIYWAVEGAKEGIYESAPFQNPIFSEENFLTFFTWPEDRDGVQLDWFRMPQKFRFPEFSKALGWIPGNLQTTAPIADLIASREGRRR